MYYEEKHDEVGNWYWRGTPDGEWQPFTVAMLCKKIEQLHEMLADVNR
jgi:hypothetical protein